MSELLTERMLAERARVSIPTINRWRHSGHLPPPAKDRPVRWDESAIDDWETATRTIMRLCVMLGKLATQPGYDSVFQGMAGFICFHLDDARFGYVERGATAKHFLEYPWALGNNASYKDRKSLLTEFAKFDEQREAALVAMNKNADELREQFAPTASIARA